MEIFLVGIGGVGGALSRYGVALAMARCFNTNFPMATFLVNIIGSLLLGWSIAHLGQQPSLAAGLEKHLLQVGFLGSFTTFSTFGYEVIGMFQESQWKNLVLYVSGTVLLGLMACAAGFYWYSLVSI